MLNTTVLVLNRSYLPIHVTSVRRAFTLIYQGTALAVNGEYRTFDFDGWSQLPPDPCGVSPHRSQLNLDHVIPRSLGGRTTWENVVCSCVDCNRRKGGRTPAQARLRLLRSPVRPRWTPMMHHAVSTARHEEWRPFLHIVESGQRRA
jgi:hypothetical protein